jgi:glycosyltransferase involved in cell wall biosynthesis
MSKLSAMPVSGSQPHNHLTAVLTRANVNPHAGGKAPADVQAICARMGLDCIVLPAVPDERFSWANLRRFGLGTLTLAGRRLNRLPDILIIQHPIVGRLEKRLVHYLFRQSKKIALIHDLDVLRKPTNHTFDDLAFLAKCDVVIAHNEAMQQYLVENLPGPKVLVLRMFDFLISPSAPPVLPPARVPTRLIVIGNLHPMKAAYIYKIKSIETPIAVFGPNCAVDQLPDKVDWLGVIDGSLPGATIDGFGLVWDGDSPDRLEGQWGEYLKYNAPHKLSFYVTLGLPVIVHRNSAMADIVKSEGIGFVAESIEDASRQAQRITPDEWLGYYNAVLRLRQNVISGLHTVAAINKAIEALIGPEGRGDRAT